MAEKDGASKGDEAGGGFGRFLWNPYTKEFCGRTGASWAKILIFYIIFYSCLAAFWALMLLVFYQTIDNRAPKWQQGESRIGSNPGLGFRPRPPDEKVESTLIWFTSGEHNKTWTHWAENLDAFVQPYDKAETGTGEHVELCDERDSRASTADKYCQFKHKSPAGTCDSSNSFGYNIGQPCVLIKLNRIYGWVPQDLTDLTSGVFKDNPNLAAQYQNTAGVVITCEGENPADKENIGLIEYFPKQIMPRKLFPFNNQPGYLSPYVFVQFKGPARGVLINIECKAWANNIRHDRTDREGSVHFELLMD